MTCSLVESASCKRLSCWTSGQKSSTRFHPCWPLMRGKKTSYFFSSEQRTIIGRLTGVESSREQPRAKVETNVIKEDERSERSEESKKIERKADKKTKKPKVQKGWSAEGIKIRQWEFGKWEEQRGYSKIHASSCPGKRADLINNKCQPCEIASQASWERWASPAFLCRTPAAVRTERKGGTEREWESQLVINLPQLLGSGRRGECQNCFWVWREGEEGV